MVADIMRSLSIYLFNP